MILEELGVLLRTSFQAVTEEPLPPGMAQLLLRIAFVQTLERIAEEEARDGGQPLQCEGLLGLAAA